MAIRPITAVIILTIVAMSLTAAVPGSATAAGPITLTDPQLHDLTVQLDRNARYLKEHYLDLRKIAEHLIQGPDPLLNAVQKCALYVRQAETICRYEYELLALANYIRADRQADYFTLRRKTLSRAAAESRFLTRLMGVYEAFVGDPTVLETVQEAQRVIDANIALFERTAELLKQ